LGAQGAGCRGKLKNGEYVGECGVKPIDETDYCWHHATEHEYEELLEKGALELVEIAAPTAKNRALFRKVSVAAFAPTKTFEDLCKHVKTHSDIIDKPTRELFARHFHTHCNGFKGADRLDQNLMFQSAMSMVHASLRKPQGEMSTRDRKSFSKQQLENCHETVIQVPMESDIELPQDDLTKDAKLTAEVMARVEAAQKTVNGERAKRSEVEKRRTARPAASSAPRAPSTSPTGT